MRQQIRDLHKIDSPHGTEITTAGFSLRGDVDKALCSRLAEEIVRTVGMRVSDKPVVFDFPLVNGQASSDFMIVQPLVDSFVAIDAWPSIGGLYVHIVSCKDFEPDVLCPLFRSFGLVVRGITGGYLNL